MPTLAPDRSQHQIPIHILTGFLGSGKTSLLNALLHHQDMTHTAVIVNEFGDIGIDHLLVETAEEDLRLLAGGCLCCSVRGDLLKTLEELWHKRDKGEISPFRRVVIETSGLADPAPILRTLLDDSFVSAHYRLGQIVTTIDTLNATHQLEEFDVSVKQAALANHLILTKTDCQIEDGHISLLEQRLQRFNANANVTHRHRDALNPSILFNDDITLNSRHIFNTLALSDDTVQHRHEDYIHSFSLEYIPCLAWLDLEYWLQQITRLRGNDVLRIKGILHTCETDLPVVLQGVQHIIQKPTTLPRWPHPPRSQIVFITRNIPQSVLEESLKALLASENAVQRCQAANLFLSAAT